MTMFNKIMNDMNSWEKMTGLSIEEIGILIDRMSNFVLTIGRFQHKDMANNSVFKQVPTINKELKAFIEAEDSLVIKDLSLDELWQLVGIYNDGADYVRREIRNRQGDLKAKEQH